MISDLFGPDPLSADTPHYGARLTLRTTPWTALIILEWATWPEDEEHGTSATTYLHVGVWVSGRAVMRSLTLCPDVTKAFRTTAHRPLLFTEPSIPLRFRAFRQEC
ncbi:hypothetical protein PILCRDRAFT_821925 [Piloderma croceum F 1598]|uniref:Uncharacterized protein n=1 Tax=Piloderma croceum (strain F 1598) TaxID=765440 RepID=A0A0C3BUW4_PILCF|nr:hypothetical protein PILCRDRAFT_821925 [Piloderma croceum F 1598]